MSRPTEHTESEGAGQRAAVSGDREERIQKPRSIGRYAVVRLLGQGGMGRVWLARDTVLERSVAIKVLRDDLALPPQARDELIVRMGHEARAAAAVSHPNIVVLHDMGEDDAVGLFLVFEYVTVKGDAGTPGAGSGDVVVSLRDRLKRGRLSLPEIAKLARELGHALTFAHEAGVIHRDVKPENVLFSRTGAKIADFGIARIPDSTITRVNAVLGTPAYTAPESLSTGSFGPFSDQFSLAATVYEAMTGSRAFDGIDAIATAGLVSSDPPPPLDDSVGPLATTRALDAVIRRGLAKTPEARFATCAELGEEIARVIAEAETRRPTPRPSGTLPINPAIIEVERTPLSSRMAIVERAMSEHASPLTGRGDSQRPSIFLRRRTHRVQNIAAAIAMLVIVILILLGRRAPPVSNAARSDTALARSADVPPAVLKAHPKQRAPSPDTPADDGAPAPVDSAY